MRSRFKLAALCLIIGPVGALAQQPVQAVFALCPTGSPLFTERGVQVPAQFLPDSGVRPSPALPESNSADVVRFVVDTTGRVEARTFVALRLSDSSLVHRAQNSIGRWRYEPARASGCPVRQLVIAALRPLSSQIAPLTPADVRIITALVVEDVAPVAGRLGQRPTIDRPLILDYQQITKAFKAVGGPDTVDLPELHRPFSAQAHDDVVGCSQPKIHRDCQVANDGIFVTITQVALDDNTGQIRARAAVTWTYGGPAGIPQLEGYAVDIFFSRDAAGWKVVRHGSYLAS